MFDKVVNGYTNGREVYEDVASILEAKQKDLQSYTKELSDYVLNNGVFNLSTIMEFCPFELLSASEISLVNTFRPLILENIYNRKNFKSKLYMASHDLFGDMCNIGDSISYRGRDIEYGFDIEDNVNGIYEDLDEIVYRSGVLDTFKKILMDDNIDETNTVSIEFPFKEISTKNQDSLEATFNCETMVCPYGSKYEGHYWSWPFDLIKFDIDLEKEEKIKDDTKCQIILPANATIELYKTEKEKIEVCAKDLKEYMKGGK